MKMRSMVSSESSRRTFRKGNCNMRRYTRVFSVGTILALLLVGAGCTSAGPYVTNISSDGNGNLVIEKDTVEFNYFTGVIHNGGNPTVMTIKVK